MSDAPEKLVPIGERYIEKEACSKCQGNGYTVSTSSKRCAKCDGLGWSTGFDGEPMICDTCAGEKMIAAEKRSECKCCVGKGYQVVVMQDFEGEFPCEECGGSGRVKCGCVEGDYADIECETCKGSGGVDLDEPVDCPECHRTGISPETKSEELSLKQWQRSSLAGDVCKQFGDDCLVGMGQGDRIILDDGRTLSVILCPKCGSVEEKRHCWLCNGKKIIRVLVQRRVSCWRCGGRGFLTSRDCHACNGAGFAGCDDCDGTLKVMCQECDGTGSVSRIVSKIV